MSIWKNPFIFLPEDKREEPDESDRLLDQADALLHKHQPPEPDDMPVLTEAIEDDGIPVLSRAIDESAPSPTHTAAVPESLPPDFVEQLIELDAVIHRRVDEWLVTELPVLLEREIQAARERIRDEIHAQVRATLLADISQEISELLDANDPRRR